MNKAFGLITGVILLLFLASCSSIIESEYRTVASHEEETPADESSDDYISVTSYSALKNAIIGMVRNSESKAVIRLENYDGDGETDIYNATYEVLNETALGAYVVKYFRCGAVSRFIGYDEVELSIAYKRTAEEISKIITATTADMAGQAIGTALENHETELALMISSQYVQESIVGETVDAYYVQNPLKLLLPPAYTTTLYPNTGSQQILEIRLTYPQSAEESASMLAELGARAEELAGAQNEDDVLQKVLGISRALADGTAYLDAEEANSTDEKPISAAAYGALVEGSASSEGFAMGLKAALDLMDIESYVVAGRLENVWHYWNIVAIDGAYYHIDLTMCKTEGFTEGFLKSDADMFARYWWDTGVYPTCEGGLVYGGG